MRQVILDTETTGLNPATGDRIIEIGCVEMVGRRLTDRTFHYYINDLGFLDNEFTLLKRPPFRGLAAKITDTLLDARQMFPGKRNSLDALCDRFAISNKHRTLHGALLDAQLLAEVYLSMTRGQEDLTIDLVDYTVNMDAMGQAKALPSKLKLLKATAEECASHERILLEIIKASKKDSVWSPSAQESD